MKPIEAVSRLLANVDHPMVPIEVQQATGLSLADTVKALARLRAEGKVTTTDGAWHLVDYRGAEQRAFERLSIPAQVAFAYLATVVADEHRRIRTGHSHTWIGDLASELEPVVCLAHLHIEELRRAVLAIVDPGRPFVRFELEGDGKVLQLSHKVVLSPALLEACDTRTVPQLRAAGELDGDGARDGGEDS